MTNIDYDPYDGPMSFSKRVPPMNNIDLEIIAGIFGNLCSHSGFCVRAEYERGTGTVYDLIRWGLGLNTKIQHCPHDDLYEKDKTLCIAGCTKEAWHSCLTLDDFSERWRKERIGRRGRMINSREKELKAIAEIFSNICRADNRCVKLIYDDLEETKAIELLRYPYHIESCPLRNLTIRRCSECKAEHWYQFLEDAESKVE